MTGPAERIAVVLEKGLGAGRSANVAAVLVAGIGAALPGMAGPPITDACGVSTAGCARVPVPILQAEGPVLSALLRRACPHPPEAAVVVFPALAETVHDYPSYREEVGRRDLAAEPLRGLAVAGPARWVRSLTGSLELLR